MAVTYRHTQFGALMLVGLLIGAIVLVLASYAIPVPPAGFVLRALAAVFVVLAFLFSSLTVAVTDRELLWHFGPGLWKYRMARAEIGTVRVVRNSWLNGFGIRMRPGFRLYTISGLDAVELRLKTGDIRRIGTNDPRGLAAALQS